MNSEVAAAGYRKAFWRFVPFLMLCYTVSYLDRVNIGFAKLQMNAALGLSERIYGLGAGVFFLGYFVFQVPANLVLERIGARRWIACIMAAWGVVSCLFIFTSGTASFLTLRFLLGAAEAGFYPGVLFYLTQWFPTYRRGTIVAMFMSAIPLAGLFGNPLSGWIMSTTDAHGGLAGWQWLFLLEGAPAFLVGALVYFVLQDRMDEATWLTPEEKSIMQQETASGGAHVTVSFGEALRDPRTWGMAMIYFAIVMGQYGVTFWMPTFVAQAGARGSFAIGLLSAIPFAFAVIVMNLFGRSADRMRERRWHLIIPSLIGALGFALLPFMHSVPLAVASLSLAAAGVLTATPLFWSLPTAYLQGRAAAGGIAVINAIGNLAGFASPSLIGWIRNTTHSSNAALYMLAAILIAGVFAILCVSAEQVNR